MAVLLTVDEGFIWKLIGSKFTKPLIINIETLIRMLIIPSFLEIGYVMNRGASKGTNNE